MTGQTIRSKCVEILIVVALLSITGISACAKEVPLVSEPAHLTNATLAEQRAWLGEQIDAAIEASMLPEGWHFRGYEHDVAWSENGDAREAFFTGLYPDRCGAGGGQLYLALNNDVEVDDPVAISDSVGEFWASQGWAISSVTPPSATQHYIRADGKNVGDEGAHLAFNATRHGFMLAASTSCSMNETVTNWMAHTDQTNEFAEELQRRE